MNKINYTLPNEPQKYQVGDLFEVQASLESRRHVAILAEVSGFYSLVCLDNGSQWSGNKKTIKETIKAAVICRFLGRNMTIALS